MRTYNVIEYKSPEDALTIDDFYKTVGYACFYKGYGGHVNAVPINELTISIFSSLIGTAFTCNELTISIFRETKPVKMFLTLQKHGHK